MQHQKFSFLKRLTLGLLLCGVVISNILFIAQAQAAGGLLVAPTRVVFEGRDRSAHVNVINRSDKTEEYRISFVRKRMTEDGRMEVVETPMEGENFSDELIRFSPRRVILQPGQSQVVRLMLRKPSSLEAGEYRSHLLFKTAPPTNQSDINVLSGEPSQQDMSITLKPLLGISIPVIVRHGETSAKANIANVMLERDANNQVLMRFDLQRQGNRSVYGDLNVYFQPNQGDEHLVSHAKGVVVYQPNAQRMVRMRLTGEHNMLEEKGSYRITYTARDGKEEQLAEAVFHSQ